MRNDPLKGAIALLRYENEHTPTYAYVLCYATNRPGRYMGISQRGSWGKTQRPRRVREGAVGGMDQWGMEQGTVIDPQQFPHRLIGLLDLPEHEIRGMEAMGVRKARPEERQLPKSTDTPSEGHP